jgi:serine/threonine protein phosphatase PrpC
MPTDPEHIPTSEDLHGVFGSISLGPCGFWGWSEVLPYRGEDAKPLCEALTDQSVVMAICDGMGGAGAHRYETADGYRSGAAIASELVIGAVGSAMRVGRSESIPALIMQALFEQNQSVAPSSSAIGQTARVKGTLARKFPTTLVYARVLRTDSGNTVELGWAGDSRAYTLSFEQGLQQLTTDDSHAPIDAFESLQHDPQMSNFVSASRDFYFNRADIFLDLPTIVILASDGCFNYLRVPHEFELIILQSMHEASSLETWVNRLSRDLKATYDDVSFAVYLSGWKDFSDLRRMFEDRYRYLKHLFKQLDAGQLTAKDVWLEQRTNFEYWLTRSEVRREACLIQSGMTSSPPLNVFKPVPQAPHFNTNVESEGSRQTPLSGEDGAQETPSASEFVNSKSATHQAMSEQGLIGAAYFLYYRDELDLEGVWYYREMDVKGNIVQRHSFNRSKSNQFPRQFAEKIKEFMIKHPNSPFFIPKIQPDSQMYPPESLDYNAIRQIHQLTYEKSDLNFAYFPYEKPKYPDLYYKDESKIDDDLCQIVFREGLIDA